MKNKDKPARPVRKLLVGIVCLVLAFTIIPRVKTVYELTSQKTQLEQQRTILQKTSEKLTSEAQNVDSPENIEKIAREQLGMVKKGEKTLIQVVQDK